MTFYELIDFLHRLFSALTTVDSLIILGFLLGAFLIGWIFGRWSYHAKYKLLKRNFKEQGDELVMLRASHESLQKQSAEQINDLQAAKLEQEEVQTSLHNLEIEKTQIHNELNVSKDQIAELLSRNAAYVSQIEELQHQMVIIEEDEGESDEEEELNLETGGFEEVANLTNNYNNTIDRLSAIEDKLSQLEMENQQLKTQVSKLQMSADVLDNSDNEVGAAGDAENQKMLNGRLAIRNALGVRIPKASPAERDKLQRINGIGPFIEEKLNEVGIYNYEQISQLDNELIEKVTDAIQFFPGRILRDNWVGQARALLEIKK